MFEFLSPPVIGVGVLVLIALLVPRLLRMRAERRAEAQRQMLDRLDTVADWPAEGTRLLNASSRQAHSTLLAALPECTIFAKVPVGRFVRVPRRQSYAEWVKRVGQSAVDFLVCDQSTKAVAAILLKGDADSERAQKRRIRISRVLKGAGIEVFLWNEAALPSAQAARAMLLTRGTLLSTTETTSLSSASAPAHQDAATEADNVELVDPWGSHEPRLDPPPSTWFDDLDSGPTPLTETPRHKVAA
jgi:Protein of unknown function (DUF2726)